MMFEARCYNARLAVKKTRPFSRQRVIADNPSHARLMMSDFSSVISSMA